MTGSRIPSGRLCVLLSCVSLVLLAVRLGVSTDPSFSFLAWNLFLAWIPYGLALALEKGHRRHVSRVSLVGIAVVWLLFFPNAPYIVTDLVHVETSSIGWAVLDTVTIAGFAVTGLLLAFASLHRVQAVVRARLGMTAAWVVTLGSLVLTGAGIYLGRVHQLNSWDVVTRPGELIAKTAPALADPAAHAKAFAGTLAAGLLLALVYVAAYRAIGRRRQVRR